MIQQIRRRILVGAGSAFAIVALGAIYVLPDLLGEAPPPRTSIILVAALGLGVVVTAVWWSTRWLGHEIRRLVESARDVARGNAQRLEVTDSADAPELRDLGTWFNFIAADAAATTSALRHERETMASVLEGLNQGVIALDDQHRVEVMNEVARRMLGLASPLVGEPLFDYVDVAPLRALISSPGTEVDELVLPSGATVLGRKEPRDTGAGCVVLLEDVTAMRRLETIRRDFIANVSHELRTPVSVIRANAETLIAGAKDDPAMATRLMEGLHRNAERLARILADLLDLSRLDAGQYRLELGVVPLHAAVAQAMTAVETEAQKREFTIENDVPQELAAWADAKGLDHVLVNLIDNAVKYTQPGGRVQIRGSAGARVRIEIRDNGPGIAAVHRARIFERFYRADPGRSREAGGTGLGLSIVKHLVESMGGSVGVAPNEPTGSVFWLELPRRPA